MNTNHKIYDLIIIGGGSASLTAADFAAKLGASVAILEKNKIGGDCTWTGCIPSKTLLKTAKAAHTMRTANTFGLEAITPRIDLSTVMEHVRSIVDDIYQEEVPEVLQAKGIRVYLGNTQFIDPHTLSVCNEIVKAKHIIIATGAGFLIPPIQGIESVDYYTYETVWGLERLPERLLVLGAGMIGCEFSQAFQRLGSKITLIEAKECILPEIDRHAAQILEDIFTSEGILLFQNTPIKQAWQDDDGIHLKSNDQEFVGDALLVATGRRPNVNGLGLRNAGVSYDTKGIHADVNLRTNQRHIFAAGDATGGPQFTNIAGWQGFIAARNALLPGNSKSTLNTQPWTLFTDPEVAQVGLSTDEAKARYGKNAVNKKWPLSRVDRAHTESSKAGYIQVTHKKNGEILGVTIVSPYAGELINEWALAISNGLKINDVANTLHVYPTYGMANMQLAAEVETERTFSGMTGRVLRKLVQT